jgi:hypothetical protein
MEHNTARFAGGNEPLLCGVQSDRFTRRILERRHDIVGSDNFRNEAIVYLCP